MTRQTLHKLLDICIDGAYKETHDIELAEKMIVDGLREYFKIHIPKKGDLLVKCKGNLELLYGKCVYEDKFRNDQ
jgi:hypothetical protein